MAFPTSLSVSTRPGKRRFAGLGLRIVRQSCVMALVASSVLIVGGTELGRAQVAGGAGGSYYSTEVTADNPLAYWRFEEASGTVLADEVGNAHPGTAAGLTALGQPGAFAGSKAISMGSPNDQVDTSLTQPDVSSRSLEAWVKTPGSATAAFASILTTRPFAGGSARSITLGFLEPSSCPRARCLLPWIVTTY